MAGCTVATGVWVCSPWKIDSIPRSSALTAISTIEGVSSLTIRLAPTSMAPEHNGAGSDGLVQNSEISDSGQILMNTLPTTDRPVIGPK